MIPSLLWNILSLKFLGWSWNIAKNIDAYSERWLRKQKEKLTDVRSHVCIVRSFLYQQNREENWIIKKICLAPCKLVFDMPFTVKRWIRWIKCPEPIRGVCVCLCHFPLFSIQKRHKCFVVKLMRFLLNTNCISSYQTHVSFNLVILKSTSE